MEIFKKLPNRSIGQFFIAILTRRCHGYIKYCVIKHIEKQLQGKK